MTGFAFRLRVVFTGLLLSLEAASCAAEPAPDKRRAFYFWQTILDWKSDDTEFLIQTGANRLYVRLFDVDMNGSAAVPRAPLQLKTRPPVEIVPVVFIRPSVVKSLSQDDLQDLGARIVKKADSMTGGYQELQIDCDWTPSTRRAYFDLLKAIRHNMAPNVVLSATIRLHQVKFRESTGIPPVDRGALMVYGMGTPADFRTENSILDLREVSRYLKNEPPYLLPLDVALPVYSSAVLFHNGKFRRLLGEAESEPGSDFSKTGNLYCAERSTRWQGLVLSPGDCIRIEKADPELAASTGELVLPLLAPDSRLILFHYSPGLSRYGSSNIRLLFDRFHRPPP